MKQETLREFFESLVKGDVYMTYSLYSKDGQEEDVYLYVFISYKAMSNDRGELCRQRIKGTYPEETNSRTLILPLQSSDKDGSQRLLKKI